jgi:hypothetical protein
MKGSGITKHVLIVGRTDVVLHDVAETLDTTRFTVHVGRTVADVEELMAAFPMAAAILGAEVEAVVQLQMVEAIFAGSASTTVHIKDRHTGATGMVPFVEGVLSSLREE